MYVGVCTFLERETKKNISLHCWTNDNKGIRIHSDPNYQSIHSETGSGEYFLVMVQHSSLEFKGGAEQ